MRIGTQALENTQQNYVICALDSRKEVGDFDIWIQGASLGALQNLQHAACV
jgi:hypothetical protein